ncbi:MAG: hypothetical protein AB7H90_03845 [Alphaproteobacteria bacterium]
MTYNPTAFSLGSSKQALLYFDYVIPLYYTIEVILYNAYETELGPRDLKDIQDDIRGLPLLDFLPPRLRNDSFLADFHSLTPYVTVYIMLTNEIVEKSKRIDAARDFCTKFPDMKLDSIELDAFTKLGRLAHKYRLTKLPVDAALEDDLYASDDEEKEGGDVTVTLSDLSLIDIEKVTWKHVLEFRKDRQAKSKLRNLRLFMQENYKGKPRSFIEDDLHRRIEEYDTISREWGFETRASALNMIFTSKALAGAFTGSFVSALVGAPITAALTAAGGLSLEIGRSLLELKKRKRALQLSLASNPVSYIAYARSKLNPELQ